MPFVGVIFGCIALIVNQTFRNYASLFPNFFDYFLVKILGDIYQVSFATLVADHIAFSVPDLDYLKSRYRYQPTLRAVQFGFYGQDFIRLVLALTAH